MSELELGERNLKEMNLKNEVKLQELNNRETKIRAAEDKAEQKLKDVVVEAQNRLESVEKQKQTLEQAQADFRY